MFLEKLKRLNLTSLIEIANEFSTLPTMNLVTTYNNIISFTKRCISLNHDTITFHGLITMAYGWMPTMLNYNNIDYEKNFWRNAQLGKIDSAFLTETKKLVNNSIIGTSKLLHFINPDMYAIYDSNVYNKICGEPGYYNKINKTAFYISYLKKLRSLAKLKCTSLRNILISKNYIDINTSNMRAIEICLYYPD
jgi:hypothetical protein